MYMYMYMCISYMYIYTYMYMYMWQAIHLRDELAERMQEVEEELNMAISEIKKLNNANKQMSDVSHASSTYSNMILYITTRPT